MPRGRCGAKGADVDVENRGDLDVVIFSAERLGSGVQQWIRTDVDGIGHSCYDIATHCWIYGFWETRSI